jgi:hypothetical protein
MKRIKAYEVIDHGIDHSSYFPGCGTSFTPFDMCVTGAGMDAKEAYEDAVEQLACIGYNVDKLPNLPKDLRASKDEVPDDAEETYYYVSIQVKTIEERDVLISFLTRNAKIEIEATYDDVPVRGNAMASGNDELDKQVEDKIIARLETGDVWAWALVTVTASYGGFYGTDHLGCCCYASEKQFRRDAYFKDMKKQVIEELADRLMASKELVEEIISR